MAGILRGYMRILKTYPLTTQVLQTGLLMGTGDVIAQKFVEKKECIDVRRTKQYAGIGCVLVGPAVSFWYKLLDKKFSSTCGQNMKIVGIKKMLIDQIVFAPIFLAIMLISVGRLKCKTWEKNLEDSKEQYKDVLIANYKIWPFVQLVNFIVVPLNFQVLFVQTVAIFWNTYISWRTSYIEGDGDDKSGDDKKDKESKKIDTKKVSDTDEMDFPTIDDDEIEPDIEVHAGNKRYNG